MQAAFGRRLTHICRVRLSCAHGRGNQGCGYRGSSKHGVVISSECPLYFWTSFDLPLLHWRRRRGPRFQDRVSLHICVSERHGIDWRDKWPYNCRADSTHHDHHQLACVDIAPDVCFCEGPRTSLLELAGSRKCTHVLGNSASSTTNVFRFTRPGTYPSTRYSLLAPFLWPLPS